MHDSKWAAGHRSPALMSRDDIYDHALPVLNYRTQYAAELQRRFFEDFGGGPLILDP